MTATTNISTLNIPRSLEEFMNWETTDGFNGAARAVRVERWRINSIYWNEKKTILRLHYFK